VVHVRLRVIHSFPTRRSSDLLINLFAQAKPVRVFGSGSQAVNFTEFEYNGEKSDILDNAFVIIDYENGVRANFSLCMFAPMFYRSEEHTSELQSRENLVCRLL